MNYPGQPPQGGGGVGGMPGPYLPKPKPKGNAMRTKIMTGVAVVAMGIAAGAVWAGLTPGKASATEVRLEPTSSAGANPFMKPVGADQTNVAPPTNAGGSYAGDTQGLYAQNAEKPACDGQALIAQLNADGKVASAWASALSIRTEDIPSYVGSLTPVVLRSDTSVTVHGYQDGTFVPYPAVLQAGTAVFINSYGEPSVKCYSGNPLTQGVVLTATADYTPNVVYVGTHWGHFDGGDVTIVRKTTNVIKVLCIGGNGGNGGTADNGSTANGGNGGPGCVWGPTGPDPTKVPVETDCTKNPTGKGCPGKPNPPTPPGPDSNGSTQKQFCEKNPKQCDGDGIPLKCKGTNGPGSDADCISPAPVSTQKQFCEKNKDQCDANGIPTKCKGTNGPGADSDCVSPPKDTKTATQDFCAKNKDQCDANGVPAQCKGTGAQNIPLCGGKPSEADVKKACELDKNSAACKAGTEQPMTCKEGDPGCKTLVSQTPEQVKLCAEKPDSADCKKSTAQNPKEACKPVANVACSTQPGETVPGQTPGQTLSGQTPGQTGLQQQQVNQPPQLQFEPPAQVQPPKQGPGGVQQQGGQVKPPPGQVVQPPVLQPRPAPQTTVLPKPPVVQQPVEQPKQQPKHQESNGGGGNGGGSSKNKDGDN